MSGASRVLRVPYYTQPTSNSCQSTVLKMMAAYLEENVVHQSTGAGESDILDIRKDVNEHAERPDKVNLNSHRNMRWWLERHFPSLHFLYQTTRDEAEAATRIVQFVDTGFPVLLSVSHSSVAGHIVLVVGYEGYDPRPVSSGEFQLVVHDPYGRFDPWLLGRAFGAERYKGGSSLVGGGEQGPGSGNRVPIAAGARRRQGDAAAGSFITLSASR